MATRFELVLHGEDPIFLQAVGEEVLQEIERLEALLSPYQPGSQIAEVNARAGEEPVPVDPQVFALIQQAVDLSRRTGGAFDITLGPLLQCWKLSGDKGIPPSPEEIERALQYTGYENLEMDAENYTLRLRRKGMWIDLGSIGKGYALSEGVKILKTWGISSALLHGGTSSIYALGSPPEEDSWKIALPKPLTNPEEETPPVFSKVFLRDQALSVSGVWGRGFWHQGKFYGHVIDPRTGWPVQKALLSAVVTEDATIADALSTALLVLGREGINYLSNWPKLQALVYLPRKEQKEQEESADYLLFSSEEGPSVFQPILGRKVA